MMMSEGGRRYAMNWRKVGKSLQRLGAHLFLLIFTFLLVYKLDHINSYSWWMVFCPIWLFHLVIARGRFSLPAPSVPHDRNWAPCHAVVATPLIVAFELLLCIYLESLQEFGIPVVSLKVVFIPLLAFQTIILVDNFRMCRALMPGDEEGLSDEAIWETLPVRFFNPTWELSFKGTYNCLYNHHERLSPKASSTYGKFHIFF